MVQIFCNTRAFYTKFQVVSTSIAKNCTNRLPKLVAQIVQHERCAPPGGHPDPTKGGVALFYWKTINADARPTEGGAVDEIEP